MHFKSLFFYIKLLDVNDKSLIKSSGKLGEVSQLALFSWKFLNCLHLLILPGIGFSSKNLLMPITISISS